LTRHSAPPTLGGRFAARWARCREGASTPIVKCVPNFSEGRNPAVLDQITRAITSAEGAVLLDVDPGKATNRTVVTFVGEPEAVLEGAFRAIRTAASVIDMRRHQGAHARMGATDVCPFVPVDGITMEECAELARRLGKRVGEELRIPVYLYEAAASRPERRNLADVRKGEYEALPEKLQDPEWRPDFGPAEFNPQAGATVIGAREFLIAYNVNLNTRDRRLAHDIALDIREAGRAKRDAKGEIIRHPDGTSVKVPGRLKAVKAVGWHIPEYDRAQISINLVDYHVTNMHQAFDTVEEEAGKRGMRATGSELVGLVPLRAVLEAGRHYLRRQGRSTGIPERQIVETAVQSLGLRDLGGFDPDEKIIEYRLARDRKGKLLVDRSLTGFADELSTDSPAPGGGSAAALIGALGASLAGMVANLTVGRKGSERVWESMTALAERAQEAKTALLRGVDLDTEAFNRVIAANRLPAGTPAEVEAKENLVRDAVRGATLVPLSVLERSVGVFALAREAAASGNPNSVSDAGVAGSAALAAAEGAYYNVLINLQGATADAAWVETTRTKAKTLLAEARKEAAALSRDMETRLEG
jgi:glutamate formiminotransferase / formiminotetrahydrofolate cyclodeaminase